MPITCPHCSREFSGDRLTSRHLAVCNPDPDSKPKPCLCGHVSTSLTQMKRHRSSCEAWLSRDRKTVQNERRKQTSLDRYGVECATHLPEVRARRAATNLDRYGAENPFSREASTFSKVQDSLEGKRPVLRGGDNPFSKSEVKEKIRKSMLARHGAVSPQQAAHIRLKTKTTLLKRYRGELMASAELREKAKATNLERYGTEWAPASQEVRDRVRATNLERYGVESTASVPEFRLKQLEAMIEKYGSHFFSSEEGKSIVRASLLENHGVENPGQIEGHWERAVQSFRERYGVDHPLQLKEFLDKQRETLIRKYGTPFAGLRNRGMNGLESAIHVLTPQLMFTGDGAWWRWLPSMNQNKNPDFIVPGPDPEHPKRGVTLVVEAFGSYWHSKMKTGKANFQHEQELIDAYAEVGIKCLVIWEDDVSKDSEAVRVRILSFLST